MHFLTNFKHLDIFFLANFTVGNINKVKKKKSYSESEIIISDTEKSSYLTESGSATMTPSLHSYHGFCNSAHQANMFIFTPSSCRRN